MVFSHMVFSQFTLSQVAFSQTDALTLLAAFTALTSLLVMWLKAVDIKDTYKFCIVCAASVIGGFLTAYGAGQFDFRNSIIGNAAILYTASYGIYTIIFRGLGLDRVLYPKSAAVKGAQDAAQAQTIAKVSNTAAKQILNQDHPAQLTVDVETHQTSI